MTSHTPTIFDGIMRAQERATRADPPSDAPSFFRWIHYILKFGDSQGFRAIAVDSVGDIETIGDCRYAISVTDDEGSRYRVTVEVL